MVRGGTALFQFRRCCATPGNTWPRGPRGTTLFQRSHVNLGGTARERASSLSMLLSLCRCFLCSPHTVLDDTGMSHALPYPPPPCCFPLVPSLNLEVSLFERLEKAGYPVHMLTVQYRMHPEIRAFPSGESRHMLHIMSRQLCGRCRCVCVRAASFLCRAWGFCLSVLVRKSLC